MGFSRKYSQRVLFCMSLASFWASSLKAMQGRHLLETQLGRETEGKSIGWYYNWVKWYKLIAVQQVPIAYYSEYGSVLTA